ncbi:MAG: GNAT family N-acetyltransferase [Thermodesulfobacteriota bacterium]
MIRPFTLPDLDQILQIELQSFPKSPYDWATFINLHDLYPETFLVYTIPALGQEESRILGYIVFTKEGHMISVAVDPHHRRKGIGRELLERAMGTPRLKKLWAEVRKSNHGALRFYLRMGFQVTGEIPNYYETEDALVIEWTPCSL